MNKFLAFILCFCLFPMAGQAKITLQTYQTVKTPRDFAALHPDVEVIDRSGDVRYFHPQDLLAALTTGAHPCDIIMLHNNAVDIKAVMRKGYCADLSHNGAIMAHITRMHPAIREVAMEDGSVYAVPYSIYFDIMTASPEGWRQAGLQDGDIPKSFPALLDFLDAWCARKEESPNDDVTVKNTWDEGLYDETAYSFYLSQKLMESHVMQCARAGTPLGFSDEGFISLLERCRAVGARVYRTEPAPNSRYALFDSVGNLTYADYSVFERQVGLGLTEEQPVLIPASLSLIGVYARSAEKDTAAALCAYQLDTLGDIDRLFLYADAEPLLNPRYEDETRHANEQIASLTRRLENKDLSGGERREAEDDLSYWREELADCREYSFSPSRLAEYKAAAERLYFPAPGPFAPNSDTGQNALTLLKRFASGEKDARETCLLLDRIARMAALEKQ